MPPRQKLKQIVFLAVLLAVSLFMLHQASRLDFFVRESIGPGFYPAMVLGLLALCTLAALIGVIVRREIYLLSPFIEGLHDDTVLRGIARGAARPLGSAVRIIPCNGAGVFSAAWSGSRAGDGATLTVISSETPDLSAAQAAAWSSARFAPVARLYFDPEVLVGTADGDLDALAVRGAQARLAFAGAPGTLASVHAWLRDRLECDPDVIANAAHDLDASVLLAMLGRAELDAVVMPLSEARDALASGSLKALVVFADEQDAAGFGPPAGQVGAPLLAGAWAGLAIPPRAEGGRAGVLQRAMAEGLADYRDGGGEDDAKWSVEPPERLRAFLSDMARASDGAVSMPLGRLAGLLLAVAGTLGFFWVMELLGFPLTAFLFLCAVMMLIEPALDRVGLLRIVVVSAIVSIGLHQLFWRVFYVVFPDGLLFGG